MASLPHTENLIIDGPAGDLQAILDTPHTAAPAGCAVVCHPHPVHGGTMQNKVVHTLSRAFVHQDLAALRFNFRGVGESAGEFDEGEGELQDALAAIEWMRCQSPDLPLWVAGFSFGAAIAVRASIAASADGLVSVAPAVSRFAADLPSQPQCPWLVLQGDQDELVDIAETIAWLNDLDPGPELMVFEGVEHFFHGKLKPLRNAVEQFIEANK